MKILQNAVQITHDYIEKLLKPGDRAVDATMGNGNDTLFLSRLVGPTGHVFSFDIQPAALENTKKLLLQHRMDNVQLILDGHQNAASYISGSIQCAMFNLGYLPRSDHAICTHADTTIAALEFFMERLTLHGLITIAVYYGGDSGFDEKNAVMDYLSSIDSRRFSVLVHQFVNQPNCPPIAVCIEKISPDKSPA